ncbi:hypothetical protein ACFPOB_20665 [Bosea eneae]|uniref:Uncharacterized protein n=1 Tax=Bosea eneae TaxID=151454 RepID=A0ABW0IUT6_9HYPH
MDALALSVGEHERRTAAIRRLERVAADMRYFAVRLVDTRDEPEVAQGPLALATRAGWIYARMVLIQADGGMHSPSLINAIAEPGPVDSRALRGLSLSTLLAAEARICGRRPAPVTLARGGGR